MAGSEESVLEVALGSGRTEDHLARDVVGPLAREQLEIQVAVLGHWDGS